MAFGKNARKEKHSFSCFSTTTIVVFVAFCLIGVWMMMSSSVVPAQRVTLPVMSTNTEVKEKSNDSQTFEDGPGDVPDDVTIGHDINPVQEAEKTLGSDQTTQLSSENTDESVKASKEQLNEVNSSEVGNNNGKDGEQITTDEKKEADEKIIEKVDDKIETWDSKKIDDGQPKKQEDAVSESGSNQTKDENVRDSKLSELLPNGAGTELLKENQVEGGNWETQATESKQEQVSQENKQEKKSEKETEESEKADKQNNIGDAGYQYSWKLCNVSAGPDYIPCLDNEMAIRQLHSTGHYEHRERHCPDEPPTCLVPLPEGYKKPIKWPRSRDMIWYNNVPHAKLAVVKKHQNWLRVTGKYLTFPGGGTQFRNGALHYIDFIQEILPDIAWGKHSRVVLDVGCGVASFGGFLFERGVLTMSFAPKDEHEAQVQLALERGIPAISAVMGTQRLPFPSVVFDVVHCARCRVPWHADGGRLLLELDRILRPGGYFIWSATPVYQKLAEDVAIWKAMSALTKSMCWNLVEKKRDRVNGVGIAIYQKPTSNTCYEMRRNQDPPLCEESDDPNAAWCVPLKSCMHKVPTGDGEHGTEWPEEWPQRLNRAPFWLNNAQAGVYGKQAAMDFISDSEHWKRVVTKTYLTGMGIDWSSVRNVMDMKAVYGGFAAALAGKQVWIMNVVPIDSPDTLPIIYDRGLIGIHHDWCQSFSTYPRTYDLLHADHLFSKLKKRCLKAIEGEEVGIAGKKSKMVQLRGGGQSLGDKSNEATRELFMRLEDIKTGQRSMMEEISVLKHQMAKKVVIRPMKVQGSQVQGKKPIDQGKVVHSVHFKEKCFRYQRYVGQKAKECVGMSNEASFMKAKGAMSGGGEFKEGRPWQYDRQTTHNGKKNTYVFLKDMIEHTLIPLKGEHQGNGSKRVMMAVKKYLNSTREAGKNNSYAGRSRKLVEKSNKSALKYEFQGIIPPSSIKSAYDNITNTNLGHINVQQFSDRVKAEGKTIFSDRLYHSGLPQATSISGLEPTVHEEISQNIPNDQEVDIKVISLEIEVMERILTESHDVENNENVASGSRILYAEVVNDTPLWVDCEIKKRKRVIKEIDIDFDALFKLSNDVIPKNPKVLSRIMVDDDGNKFADLAIP
ncbi:hypothetical protein KI387_007877 [Taxus chinensis]|uniref:Uncharacterized protein n=1 Tax=Taxus chinensis TaxID=29808 RepID=A0AA38GQN1_TAXCH|nr:hypothetical protein KI387_007877 [Taxus chinensis]